METATIIVRVPGQEPTVLENVQKYVLLAIPEKDGHFFTSFHLFGFAIDNLPVIGAWLLKAAVYLKKGHKPPPIGHAFEKAGQLKGSRIIRMPGERDDLPIVNAGISMPDV